jgi:O-methyltransferase
MSRATSLPDRYLDLVLTRLEARPDERLAGIRDCIERALEAGVAGDLVVTGSRQGAATILARALLVTNRVNDRWLWVASPLGSWRDLDAVRTGLEACDLLDETVRFVEGPMWDALPVAPIERVAYLHLDAGTGDAVEHVLGNLDARIAAGAFVVVDEYETNPACAAAVDRFLARSPLLEVGPLGDGCVAWRKGPA